MESTEEDEDEKVIGGNLFLEPRSPKVDRHGFVVSHQLHEKVSSLPKNLPIDIGKKREIKWLKMLENWDSLMKVKNNKIKARCYKGIPQSVRSLAWQHLSGSKILNERNKNVYAKLLKDSVESDWAYVIKKDIPRTFRHHSMFYDNNSQGHNDLYNVLLAISCYDKKTGYNQAMAPIAAVLLMHMPQEEAFWTLVSVCKFYLPGYYGEKMEAMRLDGLIFGHLLESVNPTVFAHMNKHNIDPLMYIVEWMVCIYSRCLPFDTVLRIWDIFFCAGVKFLFKIGLAILKLVFPNSKDLKPLDDYRTTRLLAEIPKECSLEDLLIPVALEIKITEKQFVKVHNKVLSENPDLTVDRFRGGSHNITD